MIARSVVALTMSLTDILKPLANQRLAVAGIVLVVIFFVALVFAFLNYASVLSPFVYPLF